VADASYSPRLRTAVLLCGTGTAGVYQAGVLRALAESGVKIDVVAGHGPGAANALAAAIDGGHRLWDDSGPWTATSLGRAYRWRPALRVLFFGLLVASILLLSPLLVLIVAALLYALAMLAALVNLSGVSEALVTAYLRLVEILFNPPVLPTIVPRAVVLAMLIVLAVLVVSAVRALAHDRSRRRFRGGFWWRLVGTPLGADEPGGGLTSALWSLVRGASAAPEPDLETMGRRYIEVLADNLGQPGFREVLVAVHDLDARRDLVGALLAPGGRGRFEARRTGGGPREAETVDFTGPERQLVVDFLEAGLRLPIATPAWAVTLPADGYWRGERHHWCDRPELSARLLDEIANLGVAQVVLVGAAPQAAVPHGLRARPADLRSRIGAEVRSVETAVFDELSIAATGRFAAAFVIRPAHNPVGPFDFGGVYDEGSDRRVSLAELMKHGVSDAYRQFIEPVVAAGERIET
jgi:hypothetical protein